MGISKDPSIILLTQVLHAHHPEDLYESILDGARNIDHALERAERKRCCQVIREGVSPTQSLLNILQKHIGSFVSVIHISGIADYIQPLEIAHIANVLSQFPYLRVVYLEGCSSFELIQALLLKDVPVVITSSLPTEETADTAISTYFYKRLALGDSLKEAFEETKEYFGDLNQFPARYDIESDELVWEQLDTEEKQGIPPDGVYMLHDHRHQLNWRLPHSERLVREPEPVEEPEPAPKNRRTATLSASLAMGMVLIVGGFFLHNTWKNSNFIQEDCHFSTDSLGLKTVFLPFFDGIDGRIQRNSYTNLVKGEADHLDTYPNMHTKYLKVQQKSDIFRIIDRWVLDCNTDLLVWGEWNQRKDSLTFLSVNYVMPGLGRDSLIQGSASIDISDDLSDVQKVKTLGRDLLYSAVGSGLLEFDRYEEAVKMFKQVSFHDEQLNAEASLRLAQAYTQMGELDTARNYYEDVILSTPDNPTAYHGLGGILVREQKYEDALERYWMAAQLSPDFLEAIYNMGLVYFRLDEFAEARTSMERVLELDPRNARAKGILSAIYAKEQNEELFYKYLEAALQEGLDIQNLTTYTEVGSYQAEKRFRNLVEKY